MKKRGFVLMETIIVIAVLCVVLLMLYDSYSSILVKVKSKSTYDNTEYLYKTSVVRDYIENTYDIDAMPSYTYYLTYCRNDSPTGADEDCVERNADGSLKNQNLRNVLFDALKVHSIYITKWNTSPLPQSELLGMEATTINYITTIDSEDIDGNRLVVMFEDENNDTDKPIYQYASLRFGDRIE